MLCGGIGTGLMRMWVSNGSGGDGADSRADGVKGKRRGAWEAPRLTSRRLFHRGSLGWGFDGLFGGGQGEGILEGLGWGYGWFLLGC